MQSHRRPLALPAFAVPGFVVPVLVVAGLSLSGCAAGLLDGGVEAGIEQAIEGQTGGEGQPGEEGQAGGEGQTGGEGQADDQIDADIDGAGGAEIPEGWPAQLPQPPGEAITSATYGPMMSVTYRIPDLAAAEAYVDVIRNAGFAEQSSETYVGNHAWIFVDGDLQVSYHYILSDSGDGSVIGGVDVVHKSE